MAKCDCFTKIGENMESRIKEKLPEGASLRSSGWKQSGLFMNGGVMSVGYFIEYGAAYQEIKKDGTPKARLTKQDFPIVFTFCPFCGCSMTEPKDPKPYRFPDRVYVGRGYDSLAPDGSTLKLKNVEKRGDSVIGIYEHSETLEQISFFPETLDERIGAGHYVTAYDEAN